MSTTPYDLRPEAAIITTQCANKKHPIALECNRMWVYSRGHPFYPISSDVIQLFSGWMEKLWMPGLCLCVSLSGAQSCALDQQLQCDLALGIGCENNGGQDGQQHARHKSKSSIEASGRNGGSLSASPSANQHGYAGQTSPPTTQNPNF
ncbi:hypothetical protein DAPPUDRAFT_236742 [Daphnia pulex]|uniref:Uncharacterized protein n=1 Tax=Daphnia pulex TaxID=6669 RepID=E9G2Z7_DAPPU|nr:hypothetical protein DAPPUDRAFT_236742 [Daphnia pulex]|eukprot:EFX86129.1 hypothetical protein DAPPUDRAFT_236742 [Daphnia pulex]